VPLVRRYSSRCGLPSGHDQWVIGPGTNDQHVVPPARRTPVTRKANLVIAGGIVSGTWTVTANHLAVTWFGEQGNPPRKALDTEAARLARILDRPLKTIVNIG
jgi:hypothetical protein